MSLKKKYFLELLHGKYLNLVTVHQDIRQCFEAVPKDLLMQKLIATSKILYMYANIPDVAQALLNML